MTIKFPSPRYKEDDRERTRRVFIEIDCIVKDTQLRPLARDFLILLRDKGYSTILWTEASISEVQNIVTLLNLRGIVGGYSSRFGWKNNIVKPDKYSILIEKDSRYTSEYGFTAASWTVNTWDGDEKDTELSKYIEVLNNIKGAVD